MVSSVSECIKIWKSLNDALRYNSGQKTKKKGKSGDPAPVDTLPDDDDDDDEVMDQAKLESWELWDSMKFLKESQPNKT